MGVDLSGNLASTFVACLHTALTTFVALLMVAFVLSLECLERWILEMI
jgi:hypothetical protein